MCGNSQESFTEKSGENVDRNFEEFLATHSEEFLVIHSREFLVTHSKEFLMTSFQEFRVTHSEEFLITLSKEFLVTNSREFLVTNSREFLVTKNNQRKFLETKCFILFPPPKKSSKLETKSWEFLRNFRRNVLLKFSGISMGKISKNFSGISRD